MKQNHGLIRNKVAIQYMILFKFCIVWRLLKFKTELFNEHLEKVAS